MRATSPAAALLVAGILGACSRTADGAAAWREGRFEEAHAAFAAAAVAAGDAASPELLYDRALAALRTGNLTEAEGAADAAASRGGAEFAALRDFLRGNAAFARAEIAARQAGTVEAEPFALDVAIAHAETARRSWAAAAVSRPDWPEARRNVERALLLVEELRKRKPASDPESRKSGTPEPRPVPIPPPPRPDAPDLPEPPREDPRGPGDDASPESGAAELSPEAVARLFEKLAEKERERAALRRERREARSDEVERDW